MKRNVWIFGLILGTILAGHMLYMVNLCYVNPDFKTNDIAGYAAMVVIFSLIFFGIRNYRNKQHGVISFGKAFKTGALIALVGSTMYVAVLVFAYYLFVPDYMDKYTLHVLHATAQNNAAGLAAKTKDMENFKQMYKNPAFVILITYSEVLPIGLIVALVSALFLKRKRAASTTPKGAL